MSNETRVFARSSALSKRKQREAERIKKRNWRARLALKRMDKAGRIAAVEKMLEAEAAERARRHKRPEVKPCPLDVLKERLVEPEIKAAERIKGLWSIGAITSRTVTANYGASTGGGGELSDAVDEAWCMYRDALRSMPVVERDAVAGLVCYDEQHDPALVKQGLGCAARYFGYM